ncbi:formate dehydrogenase accessory protein FdhE [Dechloromonas denitrificans]|uniref:formate dehydrogenase accessory protein FdhE n=1 Tax=Dechloromonas denitrificans TaxID=281362 RepID=UPI001CFA427B|nr:formate dehydrogenase accessory protein FdhE [Dechloromonas denitrificans]UCV07672.1 formate dehydrogenase accessory protein FdhE [Dechloromonas denitrificans]
MPTQAIDFHPPVDEAAPYLLPVPATLFAERAERFAALAAGHSLGEWLAFLGRLSRAQHEILKGLPALPLPDAASLEQARTHRMPPLNASSLSRPVAWRFALQQLILRLDSDAPEAAKGTLKVLFTISDAELERLADIVLGGEPDAEQAALLPFIGAALQIVFTGLASQLDAHQLQPLDAHGVCPCCGSLPVASVVRLGATINNLRYLHCSLCNTEWNVARATCTTCATDQGVALLELEGSKGAVRAETCDACKSYLKIVYQEKDPQVDPVADDLATLALDMLVDEAGYGRSGPNLLLVGAYGS